MSILLFIFAALLMLVIPLATAAGIFFATLPWWIERLLKSDPATHERLELDVSEEHIGWTVASNQSIRQRLPYAPVACAVLAALVVTAIESVAFAFSGGVPRLWLVSGIIAATVIVVLAVVSLWTLRRPLRRYVDHHLAQHANDRFSFAAQTIFELWWIARQIDRKYAVIGLRSRTDALEHGRRALLARAGLGRDSALAEVIGIKNKADHDLRNLTDLVRLYTSASMVLQQASTDLRDVEELQGAIAQIEDRIRSPDLADALEEARWPDARGLLEKISGDLGRVLDLGKQDAAMPETLDDACRVLNVSDETPIQSIKAVVNAYRRVWHPDLARDEVERQQNNLRIQRINVAWDIIQAGRPQ